MPGEKERRVPRPGGAAPPASPPLAQDFNAGSLYALRSAVAAHAAAAGLSRAQVYDITAAAHELAANAVLHGAGHGTLRLWAQDEYLWCAVADDGATGNGAGPAGPGDARAHEADGSPWPVVHGHGLWMVGEIADDVRVDRGHAGTVITARFAIHSDGDGH
ncbi:ATP-binding protein [Trebonia kvetii]|uniref:ATP-binding protein n=1 Tax=Trebonia kvetii TaxID=2480626 RepID=A0A6P2C0C1_9ACTN|nr:ATP-binding protein [Trebonia kvetii]TVZ03915.1 ATP-binding protein [Trebonia kvetii]